ncbi:MAG TPA: hypothetical protein VN851_15530 [Thermoanaerobaculia bacterium]|nr:hypothetical protein [Thermoanaerobaculia bacterium]
MNTRNQKNQSQNRPSKRARLENLLFHGAKLGTTLSSIGTDEELPKLPPSAGE